MLERPPAQSVLVIDDNETNRKLLQAIFQAEGLTVELAGDGEAGVAAISARRPSLVLLDLHMPGLGGIATLARIKTLSPQLPVIVLTGDGDIATAVEATKLGADDFLTRPINNDRLVLTVKTAIRLHTLAVEVQDLRRHLVAGRAVSKLMGSGDEMRDVVHQIEQVAASSYTVLIQGETGSGKELVARAVHQESARRNQPFITLDCGAIPETLLESELFGYEKGAFTGATRRKAGLIQLAEGGSLFLDEIANLSTTMQAKLLRVLQERQIQPLGGALPLAVDVRFIAATHESLLVEVEAGRFRQDLYFRLAELIILVPPLRERQRDIVPLAQRFQEETCVELRRSASQLSEEAATLLREHSWPGNVRELRNVIRQGVLQSSGVQLEASELRPLLHRRAGAPCLTTSILLAGHSLKEIAQTATTEAEKQAILEALRSTRGNKTKAARLLGVDFKTLHLKMKKYGLPSGGDPD